MRLRITWRTDEMTLRPPGAPTAANGRPWRVTIDGEPAQSIRRPGAIELCVPGRGSNQVVPQFSRIPVPGTTRALPKTSPRVDVSETRLRSRSTTEMWVVWPTSGGTTVNGG